MKAIAIQTRYAPLSQLQSTLLELVAAVSEVTQDEAELVATVLDLLESGRARLTGERVGETPFRF